MNTSKVKQGFSIIGCGRLGINLGVFLAKEGYDPVAFCSKSKASAQKAMAAAGKGQVIENPGDAAKASPIVFITTPDTIIEPVCEKIAGQGGFSKGSTVFHLSGALSSSILSAARRMGAATGSIHPLQAFAPFTEGQASPFKGINMSIEGADEAVALGKEIVNSLRANSFTIPTEAKVIYHASAVVASNYLVTLEHFALSLLKEAGLNENRAYDILEPLIQGTLKNIKNNGSINALTGPVARGDDEIISRHLGDIDKKMSQFSSLYRILGKYTLDIAKQRKEITKDQIDKLSELFK